MNGIRCPKCELINRNNARVCQRCGASLSSIREANAHHSMLLTARRMAIPMIAVISALCIYGFSRHSKNDVNYGTGPAGTQKAMVDIAPTNTEFDEVRKLHRDFIARHDQNMTDRNGEGLVKNQSLAFDTLMSLRGQQEKITDPAAQKYFDELNRLVDKYYNQLVQYNSESAHLAEVDQRIKSELEDIRQDPALSPEEKLSRQRNFKGKFFEATQERSVISSDLNETVKYLNDLSAFDADIINSSRIEYVKPERWPQ